MSAIVFLALRILLAAALYGFLGLVLYTLWKDLKQQGQVLAARQPVPLTLTTEMDTPAITQLYNRPEILIGREPSCDFALNDMTISSHHARLSYHQNQWWLEDMASTNGTYLNGENVTVPVVVMHGDELRLGQIKVRISIGSPDHSPPS